MSKNNRTTVVLADYRARKEEEGAVYIDAGTETFRVPPPVCWPDSFLTVANSGDNVALATLLLGGPEAFARFAEAGGTAALLLGIVQDALGATVGE
jgi:hypothetical protein